MTLDVHNFIGGQPSPSNSGQTSAIFNPATGEVCAQADLSDAVDVNQVVAISVAAQQEWAYSSIDERVNRLNCFHEKLTAAKNECIELIVREHGKTCAQAHHELTQGLTALASAGQLVQQNPLHHYNTQMAIQSQPVGVCVGISSCQLPALIPLWLFPLALCCGNSFILKPSERTPSIAIKLAQLIDEAGFPRGLFQVLLGDPECVDALITHPEVNTVSFVGSTPIAKLIYQQATEAGKRVQALGSTKNHLLVMPDAPETPVCDALMEAAFELSGQHWMAVSVAVIVGDHKADAIVEQLKQRIQTLNVTLENAKTEGGMGPLISEAHRLAVRGYIEQGQKEGANLIVDGRELSPTDGYFLGGSLFDNVTETMRIYQEEIAGPVLAIVRVNSYEEGLTLINQHPLSHSGSIFTNDETRADDFVQRAQTASVGVNVAFPEHALWQSIHGSGFGSLGLHGTDGLRFFTRDKFIQHGQPL